MTSTAVVLNEKEPLTKALHLLMKGEEAVFVEKQGKVVGVVDAHHIKKRVIDEHTTVGNVAVACPVLENEDAEHVIKGFLGGYFKALPVLKDGKVEKMVWTEVLELIKPLPVLSQTYVKDVMHTPALVAEETLKVKEVRRMLKHHTLPYVVVEHNKKLVGLFTPLDLLAAFMKRDVGEALDFLSGKKSADDLLLSELMRPYFTTIASDATLSEAVNTMLTHNTDVLVVVDYGKVKGIVTWFDVIKRVGKELKDEVHFEVSGLNEDTLYYYPILKDKLTRVINKFKKGHNIKAVHLHIKEHKSVYEVMVKLFVDDKVLHLKTENYELEDVINELAHLVQQQLEKLKERGWVNEGTSEY